MAIAKKPIARISKGAKKIPLKFYAQDTTSLARALLGKTLVHMVHGKRYAARIVETEAYLGAADPACHTWKGRRTNRVHSMYLPGGHAYVYMIYGMHFCFNIVARKAEEPEAVLVRAVEPLEGFVDDVNTRGPGRLCKALGITRADDGLALDGEKLFLEKGRAVVDEEITATTRVGVDYAGEAKDWLLRFYIQGNPWISSLLSSRKSPYTLMEEYDVYSR